MFNHLLRCACVFLGLRVFVVCVFAARIFLSSVVGAFFVCWLALSASGSRYRFVSRSGSVVGDVHYTFGCVLVYVCWA